MLDPGRWRAAARRRARDERSPRARGPAAGPSPLAFWCTFGFFMLISRGDSPGLDPVSWIWLDATMVPAAVVAGARLAAARGRWRPALWLGVGLAVAYGGPCPVPTWA